MFIMLGKGEWKMTSKRKNIITDKDVAKYLLISPLLSALYSEFKALTRKKADGVLNEMKIKLVNRLLVDLRSLLKDQETAKYLDILDKDELPQNSDVMLILSQYKTALTKYYNKYTFNVGDSGYGSQRVWRTKENIREYEDEEDGDYEDEEVDEGEKEEE